MARYTVDTRYVPDKDKLAAARPRHREYLQRLTESGVVLLAGPWADGTGGFVVYEVAGQVELYHALAEDPYTIEGVAAERDIRELNVVLGAWFPG